MLLFESPYSIIFQGGFFKGFVQKNTSFFTIILLVESPYVSQIFGWDLQVQHAVKYKDLSIAAINSPSQTASKPQGCERSQVSNEKRDPPQKMGCLI